MVFGNLTTDIGIFLLAIGAGLCMAQEPASRGKSSKAHTTFLKQHDALLGTLQVGNQAALQESTEFLKKLKEEINAWDTRDITDLEEEAEKLASEREERKELYKNLNAFFREEGSGDKTDSLDSTVVQPDLYNTKKAAKKEEVGKGIEDASKGKGAGVEPTGKGTYEGVKTEVKTEVKVEKEAAVDEKKKEVKTAAVETDDRAKINALKISEESIERYDEEINKKIIEYLNNQKKDVSGYRHQWIYGDGLCGWFVLVIGLHKRLAYPNGSAYKYITNKAHYQGLIDEPRWADITDKSVDKVMQEAGDACQKFSDAEYSFKNIRTPNDFKPLRPIVKAIRWCLLATLYYQVFKDSHDNEFARQVHGYWATDPDGNSDFPRINFQEDKKDERFFNLKDEKGRIAMSWIQNNSNNVGWFSDEYMDALYFMFNVNGKMITQPFNDQCFVTDLFITNQTVKETNPSEAYHENAGETNILFIRLLGEKEGENHYEGIIDLE